MWRKMLLEGTQCICFSFVLATTTSYVFIFKTFFSYPAMSNGMVFVETNSLGATPRKKRNILIIVVEIN